MRFMSRRREGGEELNGNWFNKKKKRAIKFKSHIPLLYYGMGLEGNFKLCHIYK